jgi:AhpD family alkylhydroperoxidase
MDRDLQEFREFRRRLNDRITESGHLGLKRFLALDHQAYQPGALDVRTKELMGLAASVALRCDDCITYHLERCVQEGLSREQLLDALNVALVIGGSITIPHLRRAVRALDALLAEAAAGGASRKS